MWFALQGIALAAPFDAAAAFDAVERTLREGYAYLDRDDVDAEAWVARAREASERAPDAAALRAVVNRAFVVFTDPHLLLTPLGDDDLNVWPTSGDLAVVYDGAGYVVADVRAGIRTPDGQLTAPYRADEPAG